MMIKRRQENYHKRGDWSFTMIWLIRNSNASIHFHWSPDFQPQTIADELTGAQFSASRQIFLREQTDRFVELGQLHSRGIIPVKARFVPIKWYSDQSVVLTLVSRVANTLCNVTDDFRGIRITWAWWLGFRRIVGK